MLVGGPIQGSGRYTMGACLGRGGMGEVFRARDRLTGQDVALKQVRLPLLSAAIPTSATDRDSWVLGATMAAPGPTPDPSDLVAAATAAAAAGVPHTAQDTAWAQPGKLAPSTNAQLYALRFHLAQEFRTLASLRHPHIVSVLDYGFGADRQPFFTMELLDHAEPLHTAARPLPTRAKLQLILQILQALTYLHRRGIVHRDLKPANVLVTAGPTANGEPRVKLLDFGLAVLRQHQASHKSEISGTLGYIAPEVLLGAQATELSDLYAVGVMTFELLHGSRLTESQGVTGYLQAALQPTPTLPSTEYGPALTLTLQRLLAHDPAQRYPSAEDAARAVAELCGISALRESQEVRESLIGAAELVGRDYEQATLKDAMHTALRGHGRAIVIGGESGSGKSRLLDELRTWALIDGARVLRGQSRAEGGAGFELFVDALRTLCLFEPLQPQEASVLKELAPDLPTLLDSPIADAPTLDGQAARQRLLSVVTSILLRMRQPTVLLLEDLHWAEPDSIELLRAIIPKIAALPLLIVATYRNDERPSIPTDLRVSDPMMLGRLSPAHIDHLCTSMLGGRDHRALLEWLDTQTEGNVFFIVEAMRAIAEDAGSLSNIEMGALPQQLLTGGMQAVLSRRLGRMPEQDQALLRLAAVAGRSLDEQVLRSLIPDMADWLQRCAAGAMIEIHEQTWRFSHDKIREHLIATLSPAEKQHLHHRVAQATVAAYPDASAHAATLAYHYEQAGDLLPAAHHGAIAGASALRRGALQEAITLLTRSAQLGAQRGQPPLAQATTLRRLARAHYGTGQLSECLATVRQAMTVLGRPLPTAPQALRLALARELGIELRHRLFPPQPLTSSAERALEQEALALALSVSEAVLTSRENLSEALLLMLRGLHSAERVGESLGQANYLSSLGFLTYLFGAKPLSRFYMQRARTQLDLAGDGRASANYDSLSGFLSLGDAHFDASSESIGRWLKAAERSGDQARQGVAVGTLAAVYLAAGRLQDADTAAERCQSVGVRIGNRQHQTSGLAFRGLVALRRGQFALADDLLSQALSHIEKTGSGSYRMVVEGMCSVAALRVSAYDRATQLAESALRRMSRAQPSVASFLEGYSGMVETCHALFQRARGGADADAAERRLQRALLALLRFAWIFPVGRPRLLFYCGAYLTDRGQRPLGRLCVLESRRLATRLGIAYDAEIATQFLASQPSR